MKSFPSNPWHNVPVGDNAPHIVNAITEISKGERAKYELSKEHGLLLLDRVLYSSFHYPANYGLIPQTFGEDKDPLDIFILSQIQVVPLCLIRAKVIGVIHMIDNNEGDDKIIAVAADDVSVAHYNEMEELPQSFLSELKHFFEEYKALENKKTSVQAFGDSAKARKVIEVAAERYQKIFCQEKRSYEEKMSGG